MGATQTQRLTRHVYTHARTHTHTHTKPVMPRPPCSLLGVHFLAQHLQGLGHVEPHIGHLVTRHCYHGREDGLAYCFSIHRISDNLHQGLRRGKVSLTVRKSSILWNVEDYSKLDFYIYTLYRGWPVEMCVVCVCVCVCVWDEEAPLDKRAHIDGEEGCQSTEVVWVSCQSKDFGKDGHRSPFCAKLLNQLLHVYSGCFANSIHWNRQTEQAATHTDYSDKSSVTQLVLLLGNNLVHWISKPSGRRGIETFPH